MIKIEHLAEVSAIVSKASSALTQILGEPVELIIVSHRIDGESEDKKIAVAEERNASMRIVLKIVCEEFLITEQEIVSEDRRRALTDARKVAVYLISRTLLRVTLKEIGTLLNRDHSTVIWIKREAENLMVTDPKFRSHYQFCERQYKQAIEESEVMA